LPQPRTIDREQARAIDRRAAEAYGMSSLVLMENAGRGATDILCGLGIAGRVVICCGAGNNGGDGFVIARHLELRGFGVLVVACADVGKLRGDAAANFEILRRAGIPWQPLTDVAKLAEHLAGAAWIVDALLGTGSQGEPRPPLAAVIDQLNASGLPILAVDVPSGLDCDTGHAAAHTIRAAHTCTFVAAKPGFIVPGAQRYTGHVHVVDIGVPKKLLAEFGLG
jgi:NAD(P)H-hydrate epimerase